MSIVTTTADTAPSCACPLAGHDLHRRDCHFRRPGDQWHVAPAACPQAPGYTTHAWSGTITGLRKCIWCGAFYYEGNPIANAAAAPCPDARGAITIATSNIEKIGNTAAAAGECEERRQWNTQPHDLQTCLQCGEDGKWGLEVRVRRPEGHTVMVRGCEHCFARGGSVLHGLPLCVLDSCGHVHTLDETCETAKARLDAGRVPLVPTPKPPCPRCGKQGGVKCGTSAHGEVHGCSLCFNGIDPICVDRSCLYAHPVGETCDDARRRIEGSTCPACSTPSTSDRDGLPVCGNPACRGFGWAHRHIAAGTESRLGYSRGPVEADTVFCDYPSPEAMEMFHVTYPNGRAIPVSRIAHVPRYRPGPMVRIEPEDWP